MAESGQSRSTAEAPDVARADDARTGGDPELERLRREIDGIDDRLLALLNERARVVQAVGRLKQSRQTPVYEAGRERQIVDRLTRANPGPFPDRGLAPVFREVISATRSLERVLRVAYFGPEGTFTHLAASEKFGQLADLVAVPSIADVFGAVAREQADLGVVPVENTTEGVVTQTYDSFPEYDVRIEGEAQLRISQALLSRSGRREDVRRIASFPQALAQCRQWLERNLAGVEHVQTASTAAAARLAAEDGSVAAIGSSIAAEVYGLQIVEPSIEDRRDNSTRFLVLGHQEPAPSGNDLTSVLFTLRRDESGALHHLLEPFARCGVNLTSIQLRPMVGKPWEYLFFLDLEGHQSEPRVRQALEAAGEVALSHRVLGSFPRAERLARRS